MMQRSAEMATNEVANNFLKHNQAKDMNLALKKCADKPGSCSSEESNSIFKEYLVKSNQNIAELQTLVSKGDAAGVKQLLGQAATAGEVRNEELSTRNENTLVYRQNAALDKSVLTRGHGPYANDVQQAEVYAQFRSICLRLSRHRQIGQALHFLMSGMA